MTELDTKAVAAHFDAHLEPLRQQIEGVKEMMNTDDTGEINYGLVLEGLGADLRTLNFLKSASMLAHLHQFYGGKGGALDHVEVHFFTEDEPSKPGVYRFNRDGDLIQEA